jgi:hypothetical protein
MKKVINLILVTLISVLLLVFSNCTKEGPQGPAGPAGPAGPNTKVYDFTLTFGTSTTVQTYNMPSGSMYNKVTFVYIDIGYKDWVMLPYYEYNPGYVPVNYISVCDEILENIKIHTTRGDNQSGSPWVVDNVQKSFRAVVLETSELILNPNVDLSNYEAVKEAFDLE